MRVCGPYMRGGARWLDLASHRLRSRPKVAGQASDLKGLFFGREAPDHVRGVDQVRGVGHVQCGDRVLAGALSFGEGCAC